MHHFDRLIIEIMKLEQYKTRGFYEKYIEMLSNVALLIYTM